MNKIPISLLLLVVLALTAHAQKSNDTKDPPPAAQGVVQVQVTTDSAGESEYQDYNYDWYCDFEFYYNGKAYYYESLGYDDTEAYRGSLSKKLDNKIDSIYYSGSSCYCWVIVYQSKYFKGLNLGLWTDSNDGSFDLTKYITYDFSEYGWEPWYQTVSSYSIYCY